MPGLHHAIVFLLSAFSQARFEAIGSVGDRMGGDGIEQLFVYAPAECRVTLALQRNQWLKRFDWEQNDLALDHGGRLLSSYSTRSGTVFWIITEHDRSVTTILLPAEY